MPGSSDAVFIRAPWVESAADHVEVLASVPDSTDAGAATGKIVAVRQGRVLATAFHPELTGDGRVHELLCGPYEIELLFAHDEEETEVG